MSTLASLKAVVVVAALGLGGAAVALVISVQRNPYKFTSLEGKLAAPVAGEAVAAEPMPMAIDLQPLVELGKPMTRAASAPAVAAPKRSSSTPRRQAPVVAEDETEDRVIAAPCVEGEYRKMEENRGVRLICPGSDAMAPVAPEEPEEP